MHWVMLFSSSFYVYSMCVYCGGCMCKCTCVHWHVEAQSCCQESSLINPPLYTWMQGLSIKPLSLLMQLVWVESLLTWGIPLSPPSEAGARGGTVPMWRTWTLVLFLGYSPATTSIAKILDLGSVPEGTLVCVFSFCSLSVFIYLLR